MDTDRERVIRIVRKLTERTVERGFTPAEAAGSMAKAKELLERYQMTLLDVRSGRLNEDLAQESLPTGKRRLNSGESVLANAIAVGCDCRSLSSWHHDGTLNLNFLGYKSDAQVARYLFVTLRDALLRKADIDAIYARPIISGPKLTQWRNSFLMGAAGEIRRRLQKMKEGTPESTPQVAEEQDAKDLPPISKEQRFALVAVKQPEVEKFVRSVFPKARPGSLRSANNYSAYEKGRDAGRSVAIRRGIDGMPTKLITEE